MRAWSIVGAALRRLYLTILLPFVLPADGLAGDAPAVDEFSRAAEVALVSAVTGIGEGTAQFEAGIAIRLKPGWKFFWRSPGPFGFGPKFDWSRSRNAGRIEVHWPSPARLAPAEDRRLFIVGYGDEVILPLRVRLRRPGEPVSLRLAMEYGICSDVCVALTAALDLDLAAGAEQPTRAARQIAAYMRKVPVTEDAGDISIEYARTTPDRSAIEIGVCSRRPLADPDVFVESDHSLDLGWPTVRPVDGGFRFRFPYVQALPGAGEPRRLEPNAALHVTFAHASGATERTIMLDTPGADRGC